jgi:uncharacterized protein (DUF983 family)
MARDEPLTFDEPTEPDERPLRPALLRGWRQCCPNCGGGPMMDGYLSVRDTCPACGEQLHHHRADDMPAWATIVIVGHVIAPLLLSVESGFRPEMWVHFAIWPALTIGLTLWLLPRIKGAVVGMQWAWRMHGFDTPV